MARRGGDATVDPDEQDPVLADEELALGGGEERLPWLESDDDYEEPGVDTGRVIAFVVGALVLLALILGGAWLYFRDRPDPAMVADGSVIEAPDEPYRTRPEDPGGRQVEGTGQTSFEVAEGQTVEGRVAETAIPAPSIDREQAGVADEAPAAGVVGVQVGAYSSRPAAEAGWATLAGRFEPLRGRNHRVVEGTVDGSRVFRLQALAAGANEADELCRNLRAAGADCQVKR